MFLGEIKKLKTLSFTLAKNMHTCSTPLEILKLNRPVMKLQDARFAISFHRLLYRPV